MFLPTTRRKRKSTWITVPSPYSECQYVCRYDALAFRYVSYVTIPALGIYAIYSLIYQQHRSWYSFVITTLTSFVYMFGQLDSFLYATATLELIFSGIGFAQLVPQLIINYKLKSVAHMPMKGENPSMINLYCQFAYLLIVSHGL